VAGGVQLGGTLALGLFGLPSGGCELIARVSTFTDFGAPAGTLVIPARAPDFPELVNAGGCDNRRWLGWFFGYPRCCVNWFVDDWCERDVEEHADARAHHPVTGHLLCDACAVGPLAPLPPRPALHYCYTEDEETGLRIGRGTGIDEVPGE